MKKADLLQFMRKYPLAVQVSVTAELQPQGAVVGIAITDDFELIFDTLSTSRKIANLRREPRIAFVIGGYATGDESTVQYEGVADEPWASELARIKAVYLDVWPEGREREKLPDIVYVRVRPTWIRYSDYSKEPALIEEFDRDRLVHKDQE